MPSYHVIKRLSNRKVIVLKKIKKKKKSKRNKNKEQGGNEEVILSNVLKCTNLPEGGERCTPFRTLCPGKKFNRKIFSMNLVQNQNNQFVSENQAFLQALHWSYSPCVNNMITSCPLEDSPADYKLPEPIMPVINCFEVNEEAIKRATTSSNTDLRMQNYMKMIHPTSHTRPFSVPEASPTANFHYLDQFHADICGSFSRMNDNPISNFYCDPLAFIENKHDHPCNDQDFCRYFEGHRNSNGYPGKHSNKRKGGRRNKSKNRVCSNCGFCEQSGMCVDSCSQQEDSFPVTNFDEMSRRGNQLRSQSMEIGGKKRRKHSIPTRFYRYPPQRSASTQSPQFSSTPTRKEDFLTWKDAKNKGDDFKLKNLRPINEGSLQSPDSSSDSEKLDFKKEFPTLSKEDNDIIISLRTSRDRAKSNLKKSSPVENDDYGNAILEKKQKRIKFVDIIFNDLNDDLPSGSNSPDELAEEMSITALLQGIQNQHPSAEANINLLNETNQIETPAQNAQEEETLNIVNSAIDEDSSTADIFTDSLEKAPVKSPSTNSNLSNSSTQNDDLRSKKSEHLASAGNSSSASKKNHDSGNLKQHIKCLLDSWTAMSGNGSPRKSLSLKKRFLTKKPLVDPKTVENIIGQPPVNSKSPNLKFEIFGCRNERMKDVKPYNFSTHAKTANVDSSCRESEQKLDDESRPQEVKKVEVTKSTRRPKTRCSLFRSRFGRNKKAKRTSSSNSLLVRLDSLTVKNKLLEQNFLPYIDDDVASNCIPFSKFFSNFTHHFSKDREVLDLRTSAHSINKEKFSKNLMETPNQSQNNSHVNSESSLKDLRSIGNRSPNKECCESNRSIKAAYQFANHNNQSSCLKSEHLKSSNAECQEMLAAFYNFMSNYYYDKLSKHDVKSRTASNMNGRQSPRNSKKMEDFKTDAQKKNVPDFRRIDWKKDKNRNRRSPQECDEKTCKNCSHVSRRSPKVLSWLHNSVAAQDGDRNVPNANDDQNCAGDEIASSMVEQVKSLAMDQLRNFFSDPESEWNQQLKEYFKKATNILDFFHDCIHFNERFILEKNGNNCKCDPSRLCSSPSRSPDCPGRVKFSPNCSKGCVKSLNCLRTANPCNSDSNRRSQVRKAFHCRPTICPNKIRALEQAYDAQKSSEHSLNQDIEIHLGSCISPQYSNVSEMFNQNQRYSNCSYPICQTRCRAPVISHPHSMPPLYHSQVDYRYPHALNYANDCMKWLGRDYYNNIHRTHL